MTEPLSRRPAVAGFAIFTLLMVVVFAGLGIWQLQRRVEKHALIALLNERLAAAPEALPAVTVVPGPGAGSGARTGPLWPT